ncbi:MAG: GAF domain-containing protein [Deinococcus sp.]|nr:GAF domain-containing protein [Deinococcus sp.]
MKLKHLARGTEVTQLDQELEGYRFLAGFSDLIVETAQEQKLLWLVLKRIYAFFATDQGLIAGYNTVSGQLEPFAQQGSSLDWSTARLAKAALGSQRFLSPEGDVLMVPVGGADWGPGVLALRRTKRPFTGSDSKFLSRLADRLGQELARRRRERLLETEQRIYTGLYHLRPVDSLYNILHELRRFVHYDHSAGVLVLDDESGELVIRAETIAFEKRKSRGIGLAGPCPVELRQLLAKGEVVRAERAGSSWTVAPELAELVPGVAYAGSHPEGVLLLAPLVFDGEFVGLLKIASQHQGAFAAGDLAVAKRFAHVTAEVVHRGLRQARRIREMSLINHELAKLTKGNVVGSEVFPQILDIILRALKLTDGSIWLINEGSLILDLACYQGHLPELIRPIRIGEGMVGSVAQTGRSVLVNDVRSDPTYIAFSPGVKAELAVPVTHEGHTIGVLNVESRQVGRFSELDREFLAMIAGRISLVAEMIRQATERRERMALVYRLTDLLCQPSPPDELLATVVDLARQGLHAEVAAILLFADGRLRRHRLSGLPENALGEESYAVGQGLTGWALEAEVLVNDVAASDQVIKEYLEAYSRHLPSHTVQHLLAVPLRGPAGPLGVLRVVNKLDDDGKLSHTGFTEGDKALLAAMAGQAAVALTSARTLQELRRAQAQLLQTEKMASLGQLVAGVAHELNNPIAFIYGNMDHLERYLSAIRRVLAAYAELPLDSAQRAALEQLRQETRLDYVLGDLDKLVASCRKGAERVKQIVADLRTFSRLDETEFKQVDIHEGIDIALNLLYHLLKKRITVHKEYGDLPLVECNAGKLNQVFMNILANAAQAISGPGEIWIKTARLGDQVAVSIKDTGCGIPPENLTRIFEPFFTTKPVGQGTGLGLSISYAIVEQHGGRISVESQVGKGSTFTVTLPIRRAVPPSSAQ